MRPHCTLRWLPGVLVKRRSSARLADDVGDAFFSHLCSMQTSRRDLAVVAGAERFGVVVADDGGLAA